MIKRFIQSAGRKLKVAVQLGRQKSLVFLPGKLPRKSDKPGKSQASEVTPESLVTASDNSGQEEKPRQKKKKKWQLSNFQVDPAEGKVRFHDIDLPLVVMHGIADLGFQYCTPVQAKSLPHLLTGKDLVGRANTGTGKTAVFLLTILVKLLAEKRNTQRKQVRALILAPTRELVMQIAKDCRGLGKYCHKRIAAIYGGADYAGQMAILRDKKCDIVVATPGRLLDFLGKGVVDLGKCDMLVVDEADRMLDMGFIPDVRRIIHRLPDRPERQTMMFSATITEDVNRLASQWCNSPVIIEIEEEQVAVETVEQKVYLVTTSEKYHVLYNLLQKHQGSRIVVFTNQKNEARKLYDRLRRNAVTCALLTGDVPQKKRVDRLERFRSGEVTTLVATDVAGRGIHIEGVSHVVNYTLPYEPEDYVHRIGRTGRAGAAGISISFACEEGSFYLPEIEKFIGRKLVCTVPEEELLIPPPKGTANIHEPSPHKKKKSYHKRRGQNRSKTTR